MTATRTTLAGLLAGTVFGLGLAISQMTNPEKVLNFLDLIGPWDPSLIFTMVGAVVVTFVGYRLLLGGTPLFASAQQLPGNRSIDTRLVTGAAIFGMGWGMAGYCPGPAVTGLASGSLEPLLFLGAVYIGFVIAGARPAPRPDTAPET
ncbi:MAG: DUF6691 family protein [Pseudomonadota bacterium]